MRPGGGRVTLFERSFYFLRHGESRLNAQGRIAGSLDTELTVLGHEQAIAAAALLAGQPIDAIYASPLRRAHDTALCCARVLQLPVQLIAEIAERDWGVLEGQPRAARIAGILPEGAETFEAFAERVLAGLGRIEAEAPLVVAHSGVFRVLCHALGIAGREAPVSNALPLRLEQGPAGWRMAAIP